MLLSSGRCSSRRHPLSWKSFFLSSQPSPSSPPPALDRPSPGSPPAPRSSPCLPAAARFHRLPCLLATAAMDGSSTAAHLRPSEHVLGCLHWEEGYEMASMVVVDHLESISTKYEFYLEPLVQTCMTMLSSEMSLEWKPQCPSLNSIGLKINTWNIINIMHK